MSKAAKLCVQSAQKNGVSGFVFNHSEYIIDRYFKEFNVDIFKQKRGAGYWLWKPYLINKALHFVKDADILIYSDAGVEFINSVHHIIEKMDEDIFFFGNNWNHVDWCKYPVAMDINYKWLYDAGGYSKAHGYSKLKQVQASVIFFKVNDNTRKLVKEWLLWCQMPKFITDEYISLSEHMRDSTYIDDYPTFQEHRHDQAILTCLQIKYGYKLHYWPATYNNGAFDYEKIAEYQNDNYPIIFHHHRKRNNEW
ncbi:MAG TPA: hypothetical protein V6C58_07045 [Allocoleopsis sp.]